MYVCISGLHHQFRQLFGLTMIEIDKKILINNSHIDQNIFLGLILL